MTNRHVQAARSEGGCAGTQDILGNAGRHRLEEKKSSLLRNAAGSWIEKSIDTSSKEDSTTSSDGSQKARRVSVAAFDYERELEDELSLKAGDRVVIVCPAEDEGW